MNTFTERDGTVFSAKTEGDYLVATRQKRRKNRVKRIRVVNDSTYVFSLREGMILADGGANGLLSLLEKKQSWKEVGASINRCVYSGIFNCL